ncbi:MAG TPA: hypothetical protein DIV86_06685 [Alphaproteobacteria bacterium]|nr:hypothetical protein [Alphaproteobacteria bacterium]
MKYPHLEILTPAAALPLSVFEVQTYLRIDGDFEYDLIESMIKAAVNAAEDFIGKTIIKKKYKASFDENIEYETFLPKQPVLSVSEVRIINADDSTSIVDDSRYYLSSGNEKLICDTIFSGKRIEVDYFAGISETAETTPDFIKQALLNHIANMYERKTASSNIPELARYLYNFHRRVRF